MKKIFVFCLLLLPFCSYAEDLHQYYDHVYKAESLLLKNNYTAANQQYDTAFLYKDAPFTSDLYNQLLCVLFLKQDDAKVEQLCEKLVVMGADKIFFTKSVFNDIRKTQYWKTFLSNYPLRLKEREKYVNKALLKKIDSLLYADQLIHCELPRNAKDSLFVSRMHLADARNSTTLSALMKDFDYLSESVIGANFKDTTLFMEPRHGILIQHEFQRNGNILIPMVRDGIVKGRIRPEVGLSWLEDGGQSNLIFLNDYMVYDNKLYYREMDSVSARLSGKTITRLLSLYQTPQSINICKLFYADNVENTVNKLIYNMDSYMCKTKDKYFVFYTMIRKVFIEADNLQSFLKNKKLVYECMHSE